MHETVVNCAICHQDIPLLQATAGLRDRDGQQAFACNEHYWEHSRFILGWMEFVASQDKNYSVVLTKNRYEQDIY